MSDTFLQILPVDPWYRPAPEQADAALTVLKEADLDSEAEIEESENPTFVFNMENLEAVYCPGCHVKAGPHGWWDDAMERLHSIGYADLALTTPCCGLATTFNDLDYRPPAGFARWQISYMDPNRPELDPGLLQRVGNALGCPVRTVYSRV
jgi:hypothetical protein